MALPREPGVIRSFWRRHPLLVDILVIFVCLLITSVEQGRVTTRTWSFDIVGGTLAPVDTGGHRGLIVDIGDRVGFMLRGEEARFGDEVAAGEAVPLRQLTRNFDAEVQLALARAQGLPEGAAVPPSGAERWPAVPAPAMTSKGEA